MSNLLMSSGAVLAALAVAAGAYASHGLKQHVSPEKVEVFRTGVDYHIYHAIGMVLVGLLLAHRPSLAGKSAGILFFVGILLFSVNIYISCLTDWRGLSRLNPVGGMAFIAGWICFAVAAYRHVE